MSWKDTDKSTTVSKLSEYEKKYMYMYETIDKLHIYEVFQICNFSKTNSVEFSSPWGIFLPIIFYL